jgi:hypothetical protein
MATSAPACSRTARLISFARSSTPTRPTLPLRCAATPPLRSTMACLNGTKLPVDAQQVTIGNKWSPLIEYLRQLPDNAALRIEYPCLLTGYERQDAIVTARGQLRRFTIVGTGNGTACAALLTTVLTRVRSQSGTRPITLPSGEYVALGGLEASLREVGAAERQVSVDELRDAAFVACRKSWQDARTAAPSSHDRRRRGVLVLARRVALGGAAQCVRHRRRCASRSRASTAPRL